MIGREKKVPNYTQPMRFGQHAIYDGQQVPNYWRNAEKRNSWKPDTLEILFLNGYCKYSGSMSD